MNPFQSVYEKIGEDQIRQLTHYFYQEVKKNQELRKLYPEEDLAPAEERLFLFLLQVFGGPQTYSDRRGHPRLRLRHLNWKIDGKMRNHWLNAMLSAMDQLDLEPNVKELMMGYFIKVANHMVNHE
ncbi:globin domain-containing protein [Algoriphagus machipongonensis]|uniref:Protozoan/cyanobacterial globin family protein n=1 Tax=Algoriphagus machipongonensis TaxID=388413 RepID=A3I308_9BACT|nr:cyanoglobin [Algoriphagus machipongonensis]EAZ79207.1 protozoan/cyanobacterial globin family protein [Algoriphagus machipongonensis]